MKNYKDDANVKKVKFRVLGRQYEWMEMKNNENVGGSYLSNEEFW